MPYYQMGTIWVAFPKGDLEILSESQMEGWKLYFTRFSGVWDTIERMEDPPKVEIEIQ